jgi:membrane protease subunit HflK
MPPPPKIIDIRPPKLPDWLGPRLIAYALGVLVLLAGLFTSVFTVPADSQAVILRFGKFNSLRDSGLQFKLPFGIDQHMIIAVLRQQKMEFGFGTPGATNETQFTSRDQQMRERSMITGDRNSALVEWVVQYRVTEPKDFLFAVRFPEDTLRDVSESVMREVIGDRSVDEVLTVGRSEIESRAVELHREYVKRYSLGVSIDQVQLKNVTPPLPVQASFNEVNQSQQERERMINEAMGQRNRVVPRARGEADKQIAEAEGQAIRRVNEAEGDASRFTALFTEYDKAPAVTRQRLYLETMAEVLPQFKRRILMDSSQSIPPLPFLSLDPTAPATPSPARP